LSFEPPFGGLSTANNKQIGTRQSAEHYHRISIVAPKKDRTHTSEVAQPEMCGTAEVIELASAADAGKFGIRIIGCKIMPDF